MFDSRSPRLKIDPQRNNSCANWLRLFPRIAGGLTTALGLVVMAGWYAHWISIVQMVPSFPPMQFNTALGFVLCGAGLLSLTTGHRKIVPWLGAVAALLGLLTLTEYATHQDIGLDQLFIKSYLLTATFSPGRMSPLTATCFCLIGLALISSSRPTKARLTATGLITSVAVMITCVAVFGFIFGLETTFGWGSYTRMAMHTAPTFLVVSTGLLIWAWQEAKSLNFSFLRWLPVMASVILMIMIALASSFSFAQLKNSNDWRMHSYDVLATAQTFLSDIFDTSRGMRGYALTGQPEALATYEQGVTDAPRQFDQLVILVGDSPEQEQRLRPIAADLAEIKDYSRRMIDLRHAPGNTGAVQVDPSGQWLALVNRTLADLRAFTDEEHRLLNTRSVGADANFNNTAGLVEVGSILAAVLLLIANLLASREVNFRRRAEADLHEVAATQQAILNSANHAIISVDTKGTIMTFNETAERWFGYSAEELIGKANPSIFHLPEEVVARAEILSREMGREIKPGFGTFIAQVGPGKSAESGWTFVRKDGSRFPVWLSISLMTDITGKVVGYLGIVADLTSRKKWRRNWRTSVCSSMAF